MERIVHASRKLATLGCVIALCVAAAAQEPPSAPQPQATAPKPAGHSSLVNSFIAIDPGATPHHLDAKDKFMLANKFFGPYTFVTAAGAAGLGQAMDSEHDYGQGAEGFGKRYGAAFADAAVNNYLGVGLYPAIFHQDPRYFRKAQGNFMGRVVYAASRTLVTRGDSGRNQFNISAVAASFSAGAVGTAYYPQSEREVGDFAVRGAMQLGYSAAWNVLMEIWPDIQRKVFHKK